MDWKRIKAEYIAGGTSYRKLAAKHNVSPSTLRKVAAKEHWTELRNQAGTKADAKLIETLSTKEAEKSVNIVDVADKLLEKIAEMTDRVGDPDSIKKLTSAIKDLKDIKGIKSDIDLREQEARIRSLEKQTEKTDDDTQVVITFGSEEAEEFAQ